MRRLAWLSLERRSRSASISTLSSPVGFTFPHPGRTAVLAHRLDAATGFETGTGPAGTDLTVWG